MGHKRHQRCDIGRVQFRQAPPETINQHTLQVECPVFITSAITRL